MNTEVKRLNGYFKVSEYGNSLIQVVLYNPTTEDVKEIAVRDYEYENVYEGLTNSKLSAKAKAYLYEMPINEKVRTLYHKKNGFITVGMTIKVIKGRKYPKGTKGVVIKKYPYYDRYGRKVADYILTDNDMKINIANVEIVK